MLCNGCLQEHTHQSILYQIYSWSWRSSIELCISPVSRARKKIYYCSNRKLGIQDFFAINNTNHITKESLTKDRSISFSEKIIWLNMVSSVKQVSIWLQYKLKCGWRKWLTKCTDYSHMLCPATTSRFLN